VLDEAGRKVELRAIQHATTGTELHKPHGLAGMAREIPSCCVAASTEAAGAAVALHSWELPAVKPHTRAGRLPCCSPNLCCRHTAQPPAQPVLPVLGYTHLHMLLCV
jgi:hypothetical protein